jgi:hypothetical protein
MMLVLVSFIPLFHSDHHLQVLAALDVHTSKWIVQQCLQGDLMRGRTVILVVRVHS